METVKQIMDTIEGIEANFLAVKKEHEELKVVHCVEVKLLKSKLAASKDLNKKLILKFKEAAMYAEALCPEGYMWHGDGSMADDGESLETDDDYVSMLKILNRGKVNCPSCLSIMKGRK